MPSLFKKAAVTGLILLFFTVHIKAQDNPMQTQLRVQQAIQKKAEYHRLTNGAQDGFRIKIHFGTEREEAENVKAKFTKSFPEYDTYKEYQQPNFVVLVGDFKTRLEAYESLQKIKAEFPSAFIVKEKIRVK